MACPSMISIPPALITMSKTAATVPSFIQTLYLFTANDFATFALPTTLFATFAALSGSPLTNNPSPSLLPTLARTPLALALIWTNLLIFNISNQRSPLAIEEDRINKPHRPLPSGRLTSDDARRTLLFATPLVLLLGWAFNVWIETLLLIAFTWAYNDLGGSDEHWVLRNLLIAIGYGLYSCAALRVVAGTSHALTQSGINWVGVVTGVMFVTQHICDIKDAEGDRLRGEEVGAGCAG
ncbi:hypothetical protein N0V90_006917 [Kalmusia sp. IMI 367209]|nr:hypothetical protein N0V90_006917 [Kalmusia sp. IMI 367209]